MSKFVEKFRKNKNYEDDFAFERNQYGKQKKREKQKSFSRQNELQDTYETDWTPANRKQRY